MSSFWSCDEAPLVYDGDSCQVSCPTPLRSHLACYHSYQICLEHVIRVAAATGSQSVLHHPSQEHDPALVLTPTEPIVLRLRRDSSVAPRWNELPNPLSLLEGSSLVESSLHAVCPFPRSVSFSPKKPICWTFIYYSVQQRPVAQTIKLSLIPCASFAWKCYF